MSVIIPTYNRAHLVGRAIQSVIDQTFIGWELLLIDDGSTDDTEKVVKRFCDHRIRYLRHEVNKGAGAARNTGIRESSGEYIALLDSDDEWLPEKLDKQLNVFRRDKSGRLGVVVCHSSVLRVGNKKTIRELPLRESAYEDLLARRYNVPNLVIR